LSRLKKLETDDGSMFPCEYRGDRFITNFDWRRLLCEPNDWRRVDVQSGIVASYQTTHDFFDHPIGNVEVVRPRAPHSRLIAVSYVMQPLPSAVSCLVDGVGDENGAAHTCREVATLFSALHQPVGCWPCQFDSGVRRGAAVCNRRQSRPLYMPMSRLRRQGCGTSILVAVDRPSAAYNAIVGRHAYRSTAVSRADQTQLRTLTEPSTSRRSASA